MPVPWKVDTLESVPEHWREEYKPAPDGSFVLNGDFPQGLSPQDAENYRKTLDRERQRTGQVVGERDQLKQQFDSYRDQYRPLEEMDEEARTRLLERIASGEPVDEPAAKPNGAGNDQAWKERLKNLGEKLGREKADLVKDYESKLAAEREVNSELARRHAIADMVGYARPIEGAGDDLRDFFASRVQVVRDPDGTPRVVVPVDGQEFEPRDWIDRLFRQTTFAKQLLASANGSGGGADTTNGATGSANPFLPESYNLTAQGELRKKDINKYNRLKAEAAAKHRGAPVFGHAQHR